MSCMPFLSTAARDDKCRDCMYSLPAEAWYSTGPNQTRLAGLSERAAYIIRPPPNMGNFGSKKTTEWSPAQYFDVQRADDDKPFALLILNQEITDLGMLENLWNNSELAIVSETEGLNWPQICDMFFHRRRVPRLC